jgi:hypothetical protein
MGKKCILGCGGENITTHGRMIFKWTLNKYDGSVWTGLIWLSIGTSRGFI